MNGTICVYSPPIGTTSNNDCSNSTQICSDQSFVGNSTGAGLVSDLNSTNRDCLSTEHQSSWYIFQATTSGTIELTITTSVDYDFAIWCPNPTCGSLGSPIRCSYAATGGNTGLTTNTSVTDNSEGASGDRWVQELNVTAGQVYIMVIDNFTSNSTPFTLDWTLTNGATLNCTPLPVELIYFEGNSYHDGNLLRWKTASENNNDYYNLEWTSTPEVDGTWVSIKTIDAIGTTTNETLYSYTHDGYRLNKVNYYRLSQVDYNGTIEILGIVAIDNTKPQKEILKVFNSLGQEVPIDTKGTIYIMYVDGKISRKFNN